MSDSDSNKGLEWAKVVVPILAILLGAIGWISRQIWSYYMDHPVIGVVGIRKTVKPESTTNGSIYVQQLVISNSGKQPAREVTYSAVSGVGPRSKMSLREILLTAPLRKSEPPIPEIEVDKSWEPDIGFQFSPPPGHSEKGTYRYFAGIITWKDQLSKRHTSDFCLMRVSYWMPCDEELGQEAKRVYGSVHGSL